MIQEWWTFDPGPHPTLPPSKIPVCATEQDLYLKKSRNSEKKFATQQRRNFHEEKERIVENSFASLSTLESKGHPCGILIARDSNNYAATPPPLPVTPTVAMSYTRATGEEPRHFEPWSSDENNTRTGWNPYPNLQSTPHQRRDV
ncbi:hypothetical protein TNCV_2155741 [Trichonephila clavipes]|nr:hypothetical protein TNCV_2155741 [Trichonephila clavipes]